MIQCDLKKNIYFQIQMVVILELQKLTKKITQKKLVELGLHKS